MKDRSDVIPLLKNVLSESTCKGTFWICKIQIYYAKYYLGTPPTMFQIWNEQCISINIHTYPEEKQKV